MRGQIPSDILHQRWPAGQLGAIVQSQPMTMGLSGAHVFSVVTDSGQYILRVRAGQSEDSRRLLHMLRLAADHGIAPPLVWTSDDGLATVSKKIAGTLMETRGDAETRQRALDSLADILGQLHRIPADRIAPLDPAQAARAAWTTLSSRNDVPAWIVSLSSAIDRCETLLDADRRRVFSHNDVNPGNVLWDGERAWLGDWDAASMNHPYYDLATLAMFHAMPDEQANALLARQESSALGPTDFATLAALRNVAGILCGSMAVNAVPDLRALPIATVDEAPTHMQFVQALITGKIDMRTGFGAAYFGAALLRTAYERQAE